MSEQELKLDKEEIESLIQRSSDLIKVLNKVINELSKYNDDGADLFDTYMQYSKLKYFVNAMDQSTRNWEILIAVGHNIMAPQLDTKSREKNGWNEFNIDLFPLFDQPTKEDKPKMEISLLSFNQ